MLLSSRPERMWTWDSSLVLQQHSALQIYLKTFIIYCLFQQPGFQHFNRGFVGFDFPHQDIKLYSIFYKMHRDLRCIIALLAKASSAGGGKASWQKRRNKETLQDVTLIWLYLYWVLFIYSFMILVLWYSLNTVPNVSVTWHPSVLIIPSVPPIIWLQLLTLTTVPSNSTDSKR